MARVIYLPGKGLPIETTVFGARKDAEITARSRINVWLKKRTELETKASLTE
jgi:hypothetical protein